MPDQDSDEFIRSQHRRNFWTLAAYQIVQRIGWIFKTESIIIPAVLDSLGGTGWIRGWLPTLNRFGQSIPPIIWADRLRACGQQRWALGLFSLGMSFSFVMFASLWLLGWNETTSVAPYLFLAIYGIFFVFKGMMDLSFFAIQGKLIVPTNRGRLLLTANSIGAICAIFFAWILMSRWLDQSGGQFAYIFGFTSFCFALTAIISINLREPERTSSKILPTGITRIRPIRSAWEVLRRDKQFRILAFIAFSFGTSLMVFPHYQALARTRLQLSFESLVTWVIVQNMGTGIFSLIIGPVADRFGNRLVLRGTLLGITLMPLLAVFLSYQQAVGQELFWIVFVMFGLTPVTIKILNNFTLELTGVEQHPRYLSTLALCFSLPIYVSPIYGLAIVRFHFDGPMIIVSALVSVGWIMTFQIKEPRQATESDPYFIESPSDLRSR